MNENTPFPTVPPDLLERLEGMYPAALPVTAAMFRAEAALDPVRFVAAAARAQGRRDVVDYLLAQRRIQQTAQGVPAVPSGEVTEVSA